MLKASPGGRGEEYTIHDFEWFSRHLPSESADLELVCAIGAAIVGSAPSGSGARTPRGCE